MSIFYNILKEKATNPETKDKIVYADLLGDVKDALYDSFIGFSYKNFYKLVNIQIKKIRERPPLKGIVFLDNSITSTAAVIAMLELKMKPILIDSSSRQYFNDFNTPFFYNTRNPKTATDYYVDDIISNIPKMNEDELVICSSGSTPDLAGRS